MKVRIEEHQSHDGTLSYSAYIWSEVYQPVARFFGAAPRYEWSRFTRIKDIEPTSYGIKYKERDSWPSREALLIDLNPPTKISSEEIEL